MNQILYYKDENGREPVREYMQELEREKGRESWFKLNIFRGLIETLRESGLKRRGPHLRHVDGEIWELCFERDRILFADLEQEGFALLHHYVKQPKTVLVPVVKRI